MITKQQYIDKLTKEGVKEEDMAKAVSSVIGQEMSRFARLIVDLEKDSVLVEDFKYSDEDIVNASEIFFHVCFTVFKEKLLEFSQTDASMTEKKQTSTIVAYKKEFRKRVLDYTGCDIIYFYKQKLSGK